MDPLAGATAKCHNCERPLVRAGTAKTSYFWAHKGEGLVGCPTGHGKRAMAAAGSIVSPDGVFECRGCGWRGNNRGEHPSWCPDPTVEATIAEPVHPEQEQLRV